MSLAALSFPLNVFAHLLQWREGGCEALHFAVFDDPAEPVRRAQQRASDLLWNALPQRESMGPVLEVGIGLGTTLARLRDKGVDVLGLTPEAAQIDEARARHGADLPVQQSRLEDFHDPAPRWRTLLLQESSQYIAPLALFEAAERLLAPGPAQIVVMDEFALARESAADWGLHHLAHFIALAERFGWQLTLRHDLSQAVQPTLDWLLQAVQAERTRLAETLQLPAATLDGLRDALQRSQSLYQRGCSGYALLRFERRAPPRVRPVVVDEALQPAMCALFGEVFGTALAADEWRWKYGAGRGAAVGLMLDGQLRAHYGSMHRPVVCDGEVVAAAQICDVMVHPDLRTHDAHLGRRNALQRMTASFLESQIGWGLPHRLGYGFPTRRAFGVAERLGLYAGVDQMQAIAWPAAADRSLHATPWPVQRLASAGDEASCVQGWWTEMLTALPGRIVGVRDAAWLVRRYSGHPRFHYELVAVAPAPGAAAAGLVVVRQHAEHLEWVDWVAAPAQWPLLLRAVRTLAAERGLATVEAWITRSQRALLDGLAGDGRWRDLDIVVPANAHAPGPAPQTLTDRWFLTAGDTDFR